MVCSVKVNMEDNDKHMFQVYCNLKQKVINVLKKNSKIEDLKSFFAEDIESPRSLSLAKTISDVIYLLEERDVLNHYNILPLFNLGKYLKDDVIIKLTTVYKDRYMNDNNHCLCENTQKVNAHFTNKINSDLHEAIRTVSRRIGKQWPVLISELGVFESQLDLVYKNHPNDIEAQAFQALQYWLKNEKENANIEKLDKALNSRLCKIKGLGSHLRIPIADIT